MLISLMLFTLLFSLVSGSVFAKTLTVGVIAPLTGPTARSGVEFKHTTEMTFEKIDYKIGDYDIKLEWINTEADPAKALKAYQNAVMRKNIDVSILGWHSSVAVALMDAVGRAKVPHLFGLPATKVVNEKFRNNPEMYSYWMMKGWATPSKLCKIYVEALDKAIEEGKWNPDSKTIAVYGQDDDWGRNFGNALGEQFEKAGWEIVYKEFFPMGETGFYPILNKIMSKNPAVVGGTISSPNSAAAFVKQFREIGIKSMLITDAFGESGEWYELTGEASNYVLDNRPLFVGKEAEEFASKFEERYDLQPGPAAAGQVYDGVRFCIKIFEETLKEYGELNSEVIYEFVKDNVWTGKLTYSGIIHSELRYNEDSLPDPVVAGDAFSFPLVQYMNGKGHVVYPENMQTMELKIPEYLK